MAMNIHDLLGIGAKKGLGTVLVAEDEDGAQELMRLHFQNAGFKVTVADDGDEALKLVENGARFDLLVLDLLMPKMNGLELAKRARSIHGNALTPVIFVTGIGKQDGLKQMEDEVPNSVVFHKPFRAVDVLKIAKDALASPGKKLRKELMPDQTNGEADDPQPR